ncbi:MAG: DUF2155 domain-containing protein [Alphaproteobacteria bacterium]|nr:DUF2155 domain-containing protein [Alphaproteobacteria bacterium]
MKNIKKYLSVLCVLCFAPCALSANEFIDKNTAVIRIMNKAAGRARSITIPVGRKTEFEKLEILIRSCKSTAPFAAQDNFMFIEIAKKSVAGRDSGNNAANATQIFSGWMIASAPGDNPLQDAEYDLWLVECE